MTDTVCSESQTMLTVVSATRIPRLYTPKERPEESLGVRQRLRNFLQCGNKDLVDTCVVTPIDFYSRRQDESSNGALISKSPVLGVRKCFTYGEMMAIRKKCPVIAQINILEMTDSSKI